MLSLVVALLVATAPDAATYTTSCPAGDDACAALAERLERLVTLTEETHTRIGSTATLNDTNQTLFGLLNSSRGHQSNTVSAVSAMSNDRLPKIYRVLGDNVDGSSSDGLLGQTTVRGRLAAIQTSTANPGAALSAADSEALQLSWWGDAAQVGLMLVGLIAATWFAAWRFLQA